MPARAIAAIGCALAVSAHAQEIPLHAVAGRACLTHSAWYRFPGDGPRTVSGPELLADISRRDIVLLGEQHDDADHHHWQLQTLATLHLLRPRMVIGFESFPRGVQPVLDKWIAGDLTVKQFLEQAAWEKNWNLPPELYLPLFQFARLNRIPIIALNIERSLIEQVRTHGWDAVPEAQKQGVSRPAPAAPAYREALFEVFKHHPAASRKKDARAASMNDEAFRYFVESQLTWDRAMAEALIRRMNDGQRPERPLLVGIMGSGHVRHGYGVPHQLRDLGATGVATLLPVDTQEDCDELKPGFADAVFVLPRTPREKPPPPRLGVRLEEKNGAVSIADVVAGSLAEMTGLRRGDSIVAIAGAPVARMSGVIGAIRNQPAGTWLPVQVRRGAETLDLVIRFPPGK